MLSKNKTNKKKIQRQNKINKGMKQSLNYSQIILKLIKSNNQITLIPKLKNMRNPLKLNINLKKTSFKIQPTYLLKNIKFL